MAQSKQFEHLQESTLKRLRVLVPHNCPLVVERPAPGTTIGGFVVRSLLDAGTGISGRFQVVAAWIDGYVAAWRRGPHPYQPDHNGECLVCDDWADGPLHRTGPATAPNAPRRAATRATNPRAPLLPDGRYGDPDYVYVIWYEADDVWRGAGFRTPQRCVEWLHENAHTLTQIELR